MALPVAGAVLAVVKSDTARKVTEGVAGLFGDTSTDKDRKARASALLNASLNGDTAALRQLTYDAFERRQGMPGDSRTPVDGKYSPGDVRDLAARALQSYAKAGGKLPESLAQYAQRINAPVQPPSLSVVEELAQGVTDTIARAGVDAAERRAAERVRQATPYVMGFAIVVAVVVGLYFIAKPGSAK